GAERQPPAPDLGDRAGGEVHPARDPRLQRYADREDRSSRTRLLLDRGPGSGLGVARRHRLPRRGARLRLGDAALAGPDRLPRGRGDGAMGPASMSGEPPRASGPGDERDPAGREGGDAFAVARRRMVEEQLVAKGIRSPRVLEAMGSVPRHRFVDPGFLGRAYGDHALPTVGGQTISQPWIVPRMLELLAAEPT